jgi:hypothetical protein
MSESVNDQLRVLRLRYQDVLTERDRLRNARASVTSQLGPLPASAAIVIGLAATVADKVEMWALISAGGLMLGIVALSMLYSGLRPYRIMRARAEGKRSADLGSPVLPEDDEAGWLDAKIKLEQTIYGELDTRQRPSLWLRPKDLQQAFRVERTLLNIVQFLFVLVIIDLLLGILVH